MKKSYKIKATLWRWPGDGGWHFVTLDRKLSESIRKIYPKGFVKITATLGRTSWDTSLFPHRRDQTYLLSVKKSVRKAEDAFEGDEIVITFKFL